MINKGSDPSKLDRVRTLFAEAVSLPLVEREPFVREQAATDKKLCDEVLALLQHAGAETMGLVDGLRLGQTGVAGDKVQSTATGELMAKLARAPKLDPERYAIETEVGKGGMGAVLRIHDQYLNRRLAMKVLLERSAPGDTAGHRLEHQRLGRFLEEAQVTSQLDHPGIVPVHEMGLSHDGKVYFTMRLVKGRTVSEVFAQSRRDEDGWTTTRALEVVLKVCDTMAYAHDKGVLHRDLKPSNVMVGRFGEVYVMDWGLAKVVGQADGHDLRIRHDSGSGVSRIDSTRMRDEISDAASSVVSMDGQQLGTPSYMPPEQARSEQLDARVDVYAIGAMMYELLAGRAPYAVPGVRQPAYRILNDVVDGPPKRIEEIQKDVPAELVSIVEKAMHRERDSRYASVLELATDLRAFLAQRVVRAYRTGAVVEMRLWVRRNKPLAGSLLAGVLLLVGGITASAWLVRAETAAKKDAIAQKQLAEHSAAESLSAKLESEAKATALAATAAMFDQLALVVDYGRLVKEARMLGPAYPEQLPAITDWLQRAKRLLGRQDELKGVLWALQESAGPNGAVADYLSPAITAGARSNSGQAAAQFVAQSLKDLLSNLWELESWVPTMLHRQQWATVIGPLTKAHPNARVTWAEARAAVAASPQYQGRIIPLQPVDVWGLVPIGQNPQSGLWEFYDLRSAWDHLSDPAGLAKLPIPEPGQDGRIAVSAASGIVWVLVPGGSRAAGTVNQIDPFLLSKYELTQGQWQRLTGMNPSTSRSRNDLLLPVETVDWFQCHDMLARDGLDLPSELQWEYAMRAGTVTKWWTGDDFNALLDKENVVSSELLPVGSKEPNAFGFFDMCGNVLEWCGGFYGIGQADDLPRPGWEFAIYGLSVRGRGFHYGSPDLGPLVIRRSASALFRDSHCGVRPARNLSFR